MRITCDDDDFEDGDDDDGDDGKGNEDGMVIVLKNWFGGLKNHLCDEHDHDDNDDYGSDDGEDKDNGEFEKMIKIKQRFDEY